MPNIAPLIFVGAFMFCVLSGVTLLAHIYNLNNIKAKTVGDGQHGTARWATKAEIKRVYQHVPFTPERWREQAAHGQEPTLENGQALPQGIVMGCTGRKETIAMVDTGDVHTMMIGAAGVGKTAYWLYPCIEYACASGMSWLGTDTKGDVARNYGTIAEKYGYHVSVIDLRNPTRSHGNNLLHLVNKYMDAYLECPDQLAYKAKAEKYAKIIAKTIIMSGMDGASFGDNAYFYDAAEGLLTATILLVAEFCESQKRHIVSVFKIIQELLAPSQQKGQNQFQQLMSMLPNDHKAKWFAGAALNTSKESMASVMGTALSRLNSFLDSELEQILCFDTEIDAERFCSEKCAVFVILPEENPNSFFMISLIIQQLYREILSVADENGGKLKNRCVFFCDEYGTIPKIESAKMMFSASRSRRLQIVPIIQSFAQLEKNYGKEGAEIIVDNLQDIIFGGFAPNSSSAEVLSKALGSRTVMSGSVSRSKNDPSQSLQMIERPLMTPDELKSMPKGQFIVMKTGFYPMKVKLKLYFDWGIQFDEQYAVPENGNRTDIPAISLALQGYNFGNGYISWALARGGYSKENAREFSQMQAAAHGWGGYGDIDYVDHVLRYYQVSAGGMGEASAIADGRFAYPFPGHTRDTYPGHNGIDISFANCYGEPVYAVAAGTVRYTQDGWTPAHGVGGMWSFGNAVFIEHGDGWISAYGHLSALAVASGETVAQGQLIGYIGSTGNSTGPHLHLALYHNGDAGIGGQNFAELAWPRYMEK